MYRAARVDTRDVLIRKAINDIALECFEEGRLARSFDVSGAWWVIWHQGREVVAFGGIREARTEPKTGYLTLSGVLPKHRGRGLQRRLLDVRLRYARKQGWRSVITETIHDNHHSANNLIDYGFRQYAPAKPWNSAPSCYWRKTL